MILLDVNVLIEAHRPDAAHHEESAAWLVETMGAGRPFLLADMAVAGFLRIVSNPRVFSAPTPLVDAVAFVDALRRRTHCIPVAPGPRHWSILRGLLVGVSARGNLVSDAYLAALAIEHGATVVTRDRDFDRFSGVRTAVPSAA